MIRLQKGTIQPPVQFAFGGGGILSERSLNKMAVMSKKVNLGFEVAPEKREQFLKGATASSAFTEVMARAARNVPGFGKREVKRK